MHPHEPDLHEGKRISIGRLLIEVTMIVFSILLALSLESCNERRHHRELAETARSRVRAEIGGNSRAIEAALPTQQRALAVFQRLAANPRAVLGADEQTILGLNPPLLSTTAFDAAIVTQALSYMEYDEVTALSRPYQVQGRMRMIESDWLPLTTGPVAVDERHRAEYFAIKHGVLAEYIMVEQKLLEVNASAIAATDHDRKQR